MRLLLTNDDGVYAPGLAALHAALAGDHQVTVAAPETEQSAVGHSITIADIIRVRPLRPSTGMHGWAVLGTPADCVKLALAELMEQPPDLVISGINLGANVGVELLYSGTVSAATEAAICQVPAVAISLDARAEADFTTAARFAATLVEHHRSLGLPPSVSLNVNVPHLPAEQIKGVRFLRQSMGRLRENFLERVDPRGRTYYWMDGEIIEPDPGSDHDHLVQGYIAITPVSHDMTHRAALGRLAKVVLDFPGG